MTIKSQIKPSKDLPEEIYVLIDDGKYAGRTTDIKNAIHFADKTVKGKLKVEVRVLAADTLEVADLAKLQEIQKKINRKEGNIKRQATLAKKKAEDKAAQNGEKAVALFGRFA